MAVQKVTSEQRGYLSSQIRISYQEKREEIRKSAVNDAKAYREAVQAAVDAERAALEGRLNKKFNKVKLVKVRVTTTYDYDTVDKWAHRDERADEFVSAFLTPAQKARLSLLEEAYKEAQDSIMLDGNPDLLGVLTKFRASLARI